MSTREYVLLEAVSRCSLYLNKMLLLLQCPFNKTQFPQTMLDVFKIITTSPYLPTNAVVKTEMQHTLLSKSNPLGQCSVFLQGQYPYKIWSIPWKLASCALKECSEHFHMSNLPFKGPVPLLDKSIFLHHMQYPWHRASLSKAQHVWNCEHYHMFKQCLIVLRSKDAHSSN